MIDLKTGKYVSGGIVKGPCILDQNDTPEVVYLLKKLDELISDKKKK